MIPQIVIYKDFRSLKKYINKIVKDFSISPAFIYTVKPVKTEISIDQVRMIKKEVMTSGNQKRFFIIESLDNSGPEAQNSLLKTLEEKQENNLFLFPIKDLAKILPTIQSRSKTIFLDKEMKVKVNDSTESLLELVEKDKSYSFLASPQVQSLTKEELPKLLDEIIAHYRDQLADNKKASLILKKVIEIKNLYQSNNLNTQLTIDNVLIFINKQ